MPVIHITSEQQFNEELKNNKYVVVDFFATWCGPCKRLAPELEKLSNSEEFKNVKFLKVYFYISFPTVLHSNLDSIILIFCSGLLSGGRRRAVGGGAGAEHRGDAHVQVLPRRQEGRGGRGGRRPRGPQGQSEEARRQVSELVTVQTGPIPSTHAHSSVCSLARLPNDFI